MALKKLLTKLEKGSQLQGSAMQEEFPSHFEFNNGGSENGNSTSIFDGGISFDQKKFEFGTRRFYDRPNQGFSREPFINKKVQIPDLDKGPSRFLGFIDSLTDGAIRGGLTTALSRSAKDVARISKFFLSQRGIGFLTTQVGLQLMNPKIEEGGRGVLNFVTDLTGGENRTYNLGVNTLAQVASNFSGVHFDRAGVLPIRDDRVKYAATVAGTPTEKNRLVELRENHLIVPEEITPLGRTGLLEFLGGLGTNISSDASLGQASGFRRFLSNAVNAGKVIVDKAKGLLGISDNILFDYNAGPSSILGIGKTTIRKYQDSKIPAKFRGDLNKDLDKEYKLTLNPTIIDQVFTTPDSLKGTDRNYIPRSAERFDKPEDSYRENNHRIRAGNPGTLSIKNKRVNHFNFKTLDKINATDIFTTGLQGSEKLTRDLIKFYFDVITPTNSYRLAFRAFLENYNDNYSGNWNKFNYAGRGEPFFTYNNFDRSVDFSFKIAAQTRHEMKPLYRKLNYLLSSTAPTYGTGGRIRGTFIRATIGSLLRSSQSRGVPGFFSNMSISWQKDYPWEIAMDEPEEGSDSNMLELPHVLDVSCTFIPIHDFIPQTDISAGFIKPLGSWSDAAANNIAAALKNKRDTLPIVTSEGGGGSSIFQPYAVAAPPTQFDDSSNLIPTDSPILGSEGY
jgi:hypothetical protein